MLKTFTIITVFLYSHTLAAFQFINKAECKDKLKNGGFNY